MDGQGFEMKAREYIELRAHRFATQEAINQALYDSGRIDEIRAENVDAMILRLNAYMLAEDLATKEHEFKVEYPKTWWQHFKQDCFPKWLLARFPVVLERVYQKVEFAQRAYYPNLPRSKFGGAVSRIDLSIKEDSRWDFN